MKFRNNGEAVQVRMSQGEGYEWILLRKGETIELPRLVGKAYKFEEIKVTEGNIGKIKVETKQIEDFSKIEVPEFEKELTKIKGIGVKTAWDITKVFPTEQALRIAILNGEEMPFRDDVEAKLRRKYDK